MPTYLTPGVYVEEVPSASKPIEGVSTSIAAFVGLAPGGPVNTPMRISNWTQFAKIFGDPNEPDNGPFMDGAYLAHSVYGFFQNGGSLCWVVRVGDDGGGAAARVPRCRPRPTRPSRRYRVVALEAGNGDVKVELTEEPVAGEKDGDKTYKLVVSSGSEKEEHEGLTLKKGRANIATKVNSASKLDQDRGDRRSLPEAQRVPATGSYTLSKPVDPARQGQADPLRGRRRPPPGHGRPRGRRRDHDGLMPDIMSLGDDVQVRDLQGKMIAHCENAGDRMAILDCPPDMLPQDILEWRMNTAGYDSKFAALYYPWLEVMNPLTNQPMLVPPSGHVAGVWCRTDATRGVHKAPANEVAMGVNGLGFQITQAEQGGLNKVGINCIRVLPGPRHPRSGARARSRATRSGATSTSGGSSTTSPSRSWRARSGACSSPTTRSCGSSSGSRSSNFLTPHLERGRAVRLHAVARRSSSSATRRPTRPRSSRPARSSARSASRRSSRPSS